VAGAGRAGATTSSFVLAVWPAAAASRAVDAAVSLWEYEACSCLFFFVVFFEIACRAEGVSAVSSRISTTILKSTSVNL
jgi:hypothetical protein